MNILKQIEYYQLCPWSVWTKLSRQCKRDCSSYSILTMHGFVCARLRTLHWFAIRAHSQQNQQPVDIWQSALRRANEGYSEKQSGKEREWEGEGNAWGRLVDIRVQENERTMERRDTSKLSSGQVYCGCGRYRWKRYCWVHVYMRLPRLPRYPPSLHTVLRVWYSDIRHATPKSLREFF